MHFCATENWHAARIHLAREEQLANVENRDADVPAPPLQSFRQLAVGARSMCQPLPIMWAPHPHRCIVEDVSRAAELYTRRTHHLRQAHCLGTNMGIQPSVYCSDMTSIGRAVLCACKTPDSAIDKHIVQLLLLLAAKGTPHSLPNSGHHKRRSHLLKPTLCFIAMSATLTSNHPHLDIC